jgi:hypothetical protein
MLAIKIHKTEFAFLVELISPQLVPLLTYKIERDYFLIETPKDVYEKVLNELSDILSEKGFDENYEPNNFGRKVEILINKFSEKFYE